MSNLIVMYHYVCPPDQWLGSVPIAPEEFEKQLIYLKEHYEVITPEDYLKETSKPKCLLTFDDATRDQYRYAFPLLKKHQLSAHFAVMSGPLANKRIPTFHLVHALLSHFSDDLIWQELQTLQESFDLEAANNYYHYEENLARRYTKYILNFVFLEEQAREYMLSKLLKVYSTEEDLIQELYIRPLEIKEMKEAGMSIGIHCVDHLAYELPAQQFFEQEILPCYFYLKNELKITPYFYTPSFGGGLRHNQMFEELTPYLKSIGIKKAFTTVKGIEEDLTEVFWMKRIDCNKLKGEKLEPPL